MSYRLSFLAEQDLEEIWTYVAEDASPATADRLIDAIVDRFDLLGERPALGRWRSVVRCKAGFEVRISPRTWGTS